MKSGKFDQPATRLRAARLLTNGLNPFLVFTALYALVAYTESAGMLQDTLYVAVELAAAAFVAGYVFLLRRRRRVGDFWISARHQRLAPALVLLTTFAVLLTSLALLGAPATLLLTTLSMGLASAAVATTTLFWKASAHSAVAGHAAAAGLLVLGLPGLLFALVLPAVLWSRVAVEAHTSAQVLAGAGIGAAFAAAFLT
jgi:membrane-associated phospholipid phosphatase